VPSPAVLVTVAAVLAASGIAWIVWRTLFGTDMPIVALGAVGGATAAVMWRFLRKGGVPS
jgi:hypothetical protein